MDRIPIRNWNLDHKLTQDLFKIKNIFIFTTRENEIKQTFDTSDRRNPSEEKKNKGWQDMICEYLNTVCDLYYSSIYIPT